MSAPNTPSGRILINGLEVQRTPQGTLRVGDQQVLLERTDSGSVKPWCPNSLTVGEGIEVLEGENLRPRRLFGENDDYEIPFDAPLAEALAVDTGSEAEDEEITHEELYHLLQGDLEDEEDLASLEEGTGTDNNWSDDYSTFTGQREEFREESGPKIEGTVPLDIFLQIWDQTLIESVTVETNRYAWDTIAPLTEDLGAISGNSRCNQWVDTTVDEIYRLIGVMILMGMCFRARVDEYWSTGILEMPGFRRLMTRDRFLLLMRYLHFVDNATLVTTAEEKKMGKIKPIVDYLNNKFSSVYTPRRELSIDESLLLWKGHLSWIQCIRTKAARFGIKTYELCEAITGYVLKVMIYTGKSTAQENQESLYGFKNCSAKAVLKLITSYLCKGYTLFMDNWYNSVALTKFLKSKNTDVVGTLNRRRVDTPAIIKNLKDNRMARGDVVSTHCGDVSVLAWKDVKLVSTVSTYHDAEMTTANRAGKVIQKPVVVKDYNSFMGGVDLKDQKLSMYLLERKRGIKWYIKVFKRFLNIGILNSYIIYCSNIGQHKKMTHRQFRYRLAAELCERYGVNVQPREHRYPTATGVCRLNKQLDHFPEHCEVTEERTKKQVRHKRGRCVRCVAKQRRTIFSNIICSQCQVFLCVGQCWKEYHTLETLS